MGGGTGKKHDVPLNITFPLNITETDPTGTLKLTADWSKHLSLKLGDRGFRDGAGLPLAVLGCSGLAKW